jgi:hypothetical protein
LKIEVEFQIQYNLESIIRGRSFRGVIREALAVTTGGFASCRLGPCAAAVENSYDLRFSGHSSTGHVQAVLEEISLCKICEFHGDDYEERRFLGCYAVWLL